MLMKNYSLHFVKKLLWIFCLGIPNYVYITAEEYINYYPKKDKSLHKTVIIGQKNELMKTVRYGISNSHKYKNNLVKFVEGF